MKYISVHELAEIHNFKIEGKLKRLPDARYGFGKGRTRVYIDEAGNEYQCGSRDDVCVGCISTADGRVI